MNAVGEWVSLLFFAALIYVMVRPGSPAVAAVQEFGKAMVALVQTATAN